jgi:hypothetical protein
MKTGSSISVNGPVADSEDLMRGGIVAVSACFALSLLAAGMALPLHWLPGQLAIVCAVLVVLPSSIVLAVGRLSTMTGLAASDFALRVGVTRWVTVGLLVVALPLLQAHGTAHSAGTPSPLFTIGIGAALCWLVGMAADLLARAWAALKVQEWEVTEVGALNASAVTLETAGRVNRGTILRDLWRWWAAGEVTLAAAFLFSTQLSPGHQAATALGLLAFVVYTLVGLLLLSQAARARQMVQWQLSGVTVPEELTGAWNGSGMRVAVLVMLGFGLLLVVHGLDVAHATVKWTADSVLLPILDPLLRRLQNLGTGSVDNCSGSSSCSGPSPAPSLPLPPHAAPGHRGAPTEINLGWLLHIWPEVLGLLILALVAYTYWRTRGNTSNRGMWREMLAILFRDLRMLLRLLGRPTRRLLQDIANRGREAITKRPGLARRREPNTWSTPRRTIIGLYLAALTAASRRGLPRRPGRTPREYAEELATVLPAGGDTFNKMTDLFVAVRYSEVPITEDRVSAMRTLWTAFRATLSRSGR